MMAGGLVIAIAVALQHFLLFRSAAAVLVTTVVLGGCAWWLTSTALAAFADSIRFQLGLESKAAGKFYVEGEGPSVY